MFSPNIAKLYPAVNNWAYVCTICNYCLSKLNFNSLDGDVIKCLKTIIVKLYPAGNNRVCVYTICNYCLSKHF